MLADGSLRKPPRAHIDSVSFGIWSGEDVLRMSAVEITDARINQGGKVKSHGVNDSHLGTNNHSMLCGTCGMQPEPCPGHFGHVKLSHPVFNVEFLPYIYKVLTCVCFYCSRLLYPADHPKFAETCAIMDKKKRLGEIYRFCSKHRVCASWRRSRELRRQQRRADPSPPSSAAPPSAVSRAEGCGGSQPTYVKCNVMVKPVFELTPDQVRRWHASSSSSSSAQEAGRGGGGGGDEDSSFCPPKVSPADIVAILEGIDDATAELLGFDPKLSKPSSMMWTNFPVPPINMRPSRIKSSSEQRVNAQDDLTHRLRNIVKANQCPLLLGAPAAQPNNNNNSSKSNKKNQKKNNASARGGCNEAPNLAEYCCGEAKVVAAPARQKQQQQQQQQQQEFNAPNGGGNRRSGTPGSAEAPPSASNVRKRRKTVEQMYEVLHYAVSSYQDGKFQNDVVEYARERKSIRQRFNGERAKKGRMRDTVCGKRMNFSARTVIGPTCDMDIDEVGVPRWMCMKLTYPERVGAHNIHRLTEALRNGPDVYPGANYLVDARGKMTEVKFLPRSERRLELGCVLKRHLVDGDWVVFNRQPSLHKMSLMAHRVRVVDGNSFRLHVAVTKPYNADFDGDEMNVSVVLSEKTRAEAQEIVGVVNNIVKDGVPIVSFQQHACVAAYLLTQPGELIAREDAFQLWAQYPDFDPARVPLEPAHTSQEEEEGARSYYYSGAQIVSAVLPPDLFYEGHGIQIRNGTLVSGVLSKGALNNGLLFAVHKDYGKEWAARILSGLYRVFNWYLNWKGVTIALDDCYMEVPDPIKRKIARAVEYVDAAAAGHNPYDTGKAAEVTEDNVCTVLDKSRDLVGEHVLEEIRRGQTSGCPSDAGGHRTQLRRNGFYEIVTSGAKGNETNIVQVVGMVGQQRDHKSLRLKNSTSHFAQGTQKALANGMITRSFMRGLRPQEYFSHLVGSRVGVVDTAVKVSETGYSQRRLGKAMEDLVVQADKTVRAVGSRIVQFVYGEDNLDAAGVEYQTIRFLRMTDAQVRAEYGAPPAPHQGELQQEQQQQQQQPPLRRRRGARDPGVSFSAAVTMDAAARSRTTDAECRRVFDEQCANILRLRQSVAQTCTLQFSDNCLCPVPFDRILQKFQATERPVSSSSSSSAATTDLTPAEVAAALEAFWKRMRREDSMFPTLRLRALFADRCSVRNLWDRHRMSSSELVGFLKAVRRAFVRHAIQRGEAVGMTATQNCAEPLTQMTLNRFHQSGSFSNLVSGVARVHEIINATKNPGSPYMTIFPKLAADRDDDPSGTSLAEDLGMSITNVNVRDIVEYCEYPPQQQQPTTPAPQADARTSLFARSWRRGDSAAEPSSSSCFFPVRVVLKKNKCIAHRVTPRDVATAFCRAVENQWKGCEHPGSFTSFSALSDATWWVQVTLTRGSEVWNYGKALLLKHLKTASSDQAVASCVYERLMATAKVRGIEGVGDFYIKQDARTVLPAAEAGAPGSAQGEAPRQQKFAAVVTEGSNLAEVLQHPGVDHRWCRSNHIRDVERVLGIHAARKCIEIELCEVMAINNARIGVRHIKLIADTMTCRGKVAPMTFSGICDQNTSVLKKASFEQPMDSFIHGAVQAHRDNVNDVTECVAWNGRLRAGTGTCSVLPLMPNHPAAAPEPAVQSANLRTVRSRTVNLNPLPKRFFKEMFAAAPTDNNPLLLIQTPPEHAEEEEGEEKEVQRRPQQLRGRSKKKATAQAVQSNDRKRKRSKHNAKQKEPPQRRVIHLDDQTSAPESRSVSSSSAAAASSTVGGKRNKRRRRPEGATARAPTPKRPRGRSATRRKATPRRNRPSAILTKFAKLRREKNSQNKDNSDRSDTPLRQPGTAAHATGCDAAMYTSHQRPIFVAPGQDCFLPESP